MARGGDGAVLAQLADLAAEVRAAASEDRISEAEVGTLTGSFKVQLKGLMGSYSEPAKVDKVDLVKGLMQENVKKILETHMTTEILESKSSSLSASADQFLKQSAGLRRQVQARNIQMKVMTVTIASALTLYLSMPLFGH